MRTIRRNPPVSRGHGSTTAATRPASSRIRPPPIAPPGTRGHSQAAPPARPQPSAPLPLKVYSPADATVLRDVLDGLYDAPGLEFEPPPIILDIGGHVGATSVWFSERYRRCTIHAYEPHPQNVAAFLTNTVNADVHDITLHPVAVVGSKWGPTTTLFEAKTGSTDHAIYNLGDQKPTGVTVRTMKASELPTADVLKISAPGCDVEILEDYPHLDDVQAVLLNCRRIEDSTRLISSLSSRGLGLCEQQRHAEILLFVRED